LGQIIAFLLYEMERDFVMCTKIYSYRFKLHSRFYFKYTTYGEEPGARPSASLNPPKTRFGYDLFI